MSTASLWPKPIPIIGVTGEFGTGKSVFGLTISPDPKRVRAYDLEMSLDPYLDLGFDHVPVPRLLLAKHPKGYRPIDLWNWWLDDVSNLPPDRYDVILVDPVTDLEAGLADWVNGNPEHFGHTRGQYVSMSGIMWGDLKAYLKTILIGRLAAKCQTFVFITHMGEVFDKSTKKPTGERKAKGKETFEEVASLYLKMERPKDAKGNRSSIPSAVVLKSRLTHTRVTPDGIVISEALPPRLPVATPAAIRQYMNSPADYSNLKPEERAPDRVMSDDERLKLQTAKAEAERDVAMLRHESRPQSEAAAPAPASDKPEGQHPTPNDKFDLFGMFKSNLEAVTSTDDLKALAVDLNQAATSGNLTPAAVAELKPLFAVAKERITTLATTIDDSKSNVATSGNVSA